MWVPGRLWGLRREGGVGTEGKTATDSSICLSFCLSPWRHTGMPKPQGVICSGGLQHLLISPWPASFSQTEISFERKRERHKEEVAALAVERKLTFPSSSSALRSKDRCSWTVVEPEEPCWGGGTETRERQRQNEDKINFYLQDLQFLFHAKFEPNCGTTETGSVAQLTRLFAVCSAILCSHVFNLMEWTTEILYCAIFQLSVFCFWIYFIQNFNNSWQTKWLYLMKEQSVFKFNPKALL